MQPLDLNLASRPFKNNAPLWLGLVASALALGWFTVNNATTYSEYSQKLSELADRVGKIESERVELERREHDVQKAVDKLDIGGVRAKSEKANEVIRWKAFSWTRLFNLLQKVQPNDVQMTSINPIFRAEERKQPGQMEDPEIVPVSVEGVAKDLKDFLAFEKALFDDPHFDRPEPENTDMDEKSRETVFRLRFWYDPRVEGSGDKPNADGNAVDAQADAETEPGSGADAAPEARAAAVRAEAHPHPKPPPIQAPGAPAPAAQVEVPPATEGPVITNPGMAPVAPPRHAGGGRRRRVNPEQPAVPPPSEQPAPEPDQPGADG
jgi:hypothetical protein